MKRVMATAVACVFGLLCHAQDKIRTKGGQWIDAKVTLIRDGEVEYKKFTNPDGPTYVEKKENIVLIKYQNGDVDIFEEEMQADTSENVASADTAQAEDLYVIPNTWAMLRYDKHSPSYVTLDRNHLTVERAYEVMGDRYDDFNKHRLKWKNWKKCWLIGIGVTAVATPMIAVGGRKVNSKGLDMATIFVPVGGMTAIALGAAKSSKHKRKAMMRLGPIQY